MTFLRLLYLLNYVLITCSWILKAFSWLSEHKSHQILVTLSWLFHDILSIFSGLSHDFLMAFNDFLINLSGHSHGLLMTFSGLSHDFLRCHSCLATEHHNYFSDFHCRAGAPCHTAEMGNSAANFTLHTAHHILHTTHHILQNAHHTGQLILYTGH